MNDFGLVQLLKGNNLTFRHCVKELLSCRRCVGSVSCGGSGSIRCDRGELLRKDKHKNVHFGLDDFFVGDLMSSYIAVLRSLVNLINDRTFFLPLKIFTCFYNPVFDLLQFFVMGLVIFVSLLEIDFRELL
jgi:hypothetical protein